MKKTISNLLHERPYDVALSAANLLLLAYIVHLLLANFYSQRQIRQTAETRLEQETTRQAQALGYFLAERRRDLERLAGDPEIMAYFENQALGMSPQYGLRAALVQIGQRFAALLHEKSLFDQPVFHRLQLMNAAGQVMVENDTALATPGPKQPEEAHENGVEWESEPGLNGVELTAPIRFKGHYVGQIEAVLEIAPAFAVFTRSSLPGTDQGAGLYQDGQRRYSPTQAMNSRLPVEALASGAGLHDHDGTLWSLADVPDTPFQLAVALPVTEILGRTSPLQQLIGLAALAGALIFGLIGYLRHLERKRLTQAAIDSEKRLSLALAATNDGVWDLAADTGEIYFSPRWQEMLGYTAETSPGRIDEWRQLIHPDDLPGRDEKMRQHLAGEAAAYEAEYRCQTGRGGWKWVHSRGKIVERGPDGAPRRLVGTLTDISSRKKTEGQLEEMNRNLEERVRDRTSMLLQAEKMASIGQLAAGIAHEINNPAGFVSGNLDTLRRYVTGLLELNKAQEAALAEPTPAAREQLVAMRQRVNLDFIREDIPDLLDESQEGMERIARIVSDLKDFSHVDKADAITENQLNELVDKAVNVAWNELKYKCEVKKDYGDLPPVAVNGGQISQVILNLLVNAAQAIESHGEIMIATGLNEDKVVLTIADNGPGIPSENLAKIFDPFFTTKPVGKGTGLGLHICQKIVKGHGGTIEVDSVPGHGAAFTISLPLRHPVLKQTASLAEADS